MADLSEADELRHRQELEAFLIKKAWRDAKFKEALLASPRTTLQQELQTLSPGVQIPDGVEVVVHEESMTKIHLVLPVNPVSTELKDDELDLVASGWRIGPVTPVCSSSGNDVLSAHALAPRKDIYAGGEGVDTRR